MIGSEYSCVCAKRLFVERLATTVQTKLERIRNYIDGQFVEPVSGNYLDNIEPATGKPYSSVADSDARDVDRAASAGE
jgi:hypothetical protein